jgi:sugar O-acyltransferase (sialic acid O-acetyltransferase NeuD family)
LKQSIFIFGAGGLGRELLAMLRTMPEWEAKGFFDDQVLQGEIIDGLVCEGTTEDILKKTTPVNLVIALGNPLEKQRVLQKIKSNQNISYPVLIHPAALILDKERVHLGNGSVVCAGSILTTGIRLGEHVLININSTVGHDVVIEETTSVMPGVNIAGQVKIGKSVLIGSGANILNNVQIEDYARIGSGAVVTKNVARSMTVVGVPAKIATTR